MDIVVVASSSNPPLFFVLAGALIWGHRQLHNALEPDSDQSTEKDAVGKAWSHNKGQLSNFTASAIVPRVGGVESSLSSSLTVKNASAHLLSYVYDDIKRAWRFLDPVIKILFMDVHEGFFKFAGGVEPKIQDEQQAKKSKEALVAYLKKGLMIIPEGALQRTGTMGGLTAPGNQYAKGLNPDDEYYQKALDFVNKLHETIFQGLKVDPSLYFIQDEKPTMLKVDVSIHNWAEKPDIQYLEAPYVNFQREFFNRFERFEWLAEGAREASAGTGPFNILQMMVKTTAVQNTPWTVGLPNDDTRVYEAYRTTLGKISLLASIRNEYKPAFEELSQGMLPPEGATVVKWPWTPSHEPPFYTPDVQKQFLEKIAAHFEEVRCLPEIPAPC